MTTLVLSRADMFMLAGMKAMNSIRVDYDRVDQSVMLTQAHECGEHTITLDIADVPLLITNLQRMVDASTAPKGTS